MRTSNFPCPKRSCWWRIHWILLLQPWKEPEETDQRTDPFPALCPLCSHQSRSPIKVDMLPSRAALSKCPFPLARYIFRWLLLCLIQVQSLSHQWVRKLGSFLLKPVVSHCVDICYMILHFTVYFTSRHFYALIHMFCVGKVWWLHYVDGNHC